MEHLDRLRDFFFALTSCCQPSGSTVKLNGRSFKLVRLLGEGATGFVYLAEDESSGRRFALKMMRAYQPDTLREAMKEIEAYRRFRHPNIIRCLDSCIIQDKEGKVVYLFLPLYQRGNLQDAINANAVNGSKFPEKDMLSLFLGTCEAVRAMHDYAPGSSTRYPPAQSSSSDLMAAVNSTAEHGEEDEDPARHEADAPLLTNRGLVEADGDLPGAEESQIIGKLNPKPQPSTSTGERQPWSHLDIVSAERSVSPDLSGNVMLTDDGKRPILMDFGSARPARVKIPNRSVALAQQDYAAEYATMPYRAPELFDVKVGSTLDEKVDIWSLGCTLFALAYSYSPFEGPEQQQGGSIQMAVLNGAWKFPASDKVYSQGLRDLIAFMLVQNPAERPDIHAVIDRIKTVLSRLQ